MLGDEDRMPSHRRLSAIVLRFRRDKPLLKKLPSVFENRRQRLFFKICPFLRTQSKSTAKLASGQTGK
jgi:hypothetical protein